MSNQVKNKGGKTGGKMYPRYSLEELDTYVELIASKTSKTPFDPKSFCAGIFSQKHTPSCKVRISALKQFGLIAKDKGKLAATKLCVQIAARLGDERFPFYLEAFRNVTVFKQAHETFSGRTVTSAQIAIYAADTIGIHLDNKDDFATKLVESAKMAGLCKDDKDGFYFELGPPEDDTIPPETTSNDTPDPSLKLKPTKPQPPMKEPVIGTNRNVNIEVKIDSTLDPETLEKHLKKLKKFGLI